MRAFATYIEYLLMTRHYCYVPGKGAYMLAEEHATLNSKADGADLSSPCRTVCFSSFHQHDDGMLANLLMEAEGMTYDEACRYIERQAPLLSEEFLQEAILHTDIENFGFSSIHIDTWAALEQKKALAASLQDATTPAITAGKTSAHVAAMQRDTIAIPKYWLRRAAVIVLIIIGFFANFLGLNDRVAEEQLAAVLDVSMFQRAALVHQSWDEDDEMVDDEILADGIFALDTEDGTEEVDASEAESLDAAEAESGSLDAVIAELSAAEEAKPEAAKPLDPKKWNESLPIRHMDSELAMAQSPTGRLYYIIIASCATEADANRALSNLKRAGYDEVGILERDGRFRLYVNFFAVKSEAETYLNRVREIDRFHDAWLLPVRDGSLSHIIKNTYNDNQLSMELSHLNQRTERDQG